MSSRVSRRGFLKASAAVGSMVAGLGLGRGPIILAGGSPNSKVGVAVIGCGGQGGSAHLPNAARQQLLAMCDVHEPNWAKGMKLLEQKVTDVKVDKVKTYVDYRKMFDEIGKEIDAVSIATPNHHHFLPAMIAMQLGKAAYVEKPMAHSVQQARQMAEASVKYKVPTQMGNQGHSGEGYRRLCEYLWAGAIGKVTEVHCWCDRRNGGMGGRPPTLPVPAGMHWEEWIGPSPYRDYHKDLHPHEWHNWYDFGNGSLGNMACHIMDGAVWALKLKWPTSVEAEVITGGTNEQYPLGDRLRYDFPARGDMPPVKVYWWDGKKPDVKGDAKGEDQDNVSKGGQFFPPLVLEWQKKAGFKLESNGTLYVGDKGIMYTACYGGSPTLLPVEKMKEYPVPEKSIPRVKGGHFGDFYEAVRAGKPTACSNFEVAAVLTEIVCLGNLAQKAGVGKKVEWDGAAMKCTNLPELNRLVQLPYRKGWTV
ncbi:MAG: Gfo/Idh/MocA family oxidoreductase [Planctomycetota bacterium]|nr:Gfo/Idh/MocA family oxidoreductase [Planctomycetota bacterium]